MTREPGWDAKAIARVARNEFGGMKEMFEHHGWPERGAKMMPSVQSRVCEAYGSIAEFVGRFEAGGKK